jgi:hypothetical protein
LVRRGKMLLIDGVKYELWTPPTEDEFERVVQEHAQDIFGEQAIYLDIKQKLKSGSGIGSIPDGYAILLGNLPQWHIIEVELSSHPLHEHIVSQVSRFINGISNLGRRTEIVNAIYSEISGNDFLKLKVKQAIGQVEVYKFLYDLISTSPILTVIIEKETEGLREAIATLAHPQIKVIEFQTFVREGVGLAVHVHLFEPLFQSQIKTIVVSNTSKEQIPATHQFERRVTIQDLIGATIIKPDQKIYGWHKNKKYEARVMPDGEILLQDGRKFSSLSMAAFKGIVGHEVNGWKWWHTVAEDSREYKLDELRKELEEILRKEYESNPSP